MKKKETEVETKIKVQDVIDRIKKSDSSNGICIFAYHSDPTFRREFERILSDNLLSSGVIGEYDAVEVIDINIARQARTIDEYLFSCRSSHNKLQRKSDHIRSNTIERLSKAISIASAQDLLLNSTADQKQDMAILRQLIMRFDKIIIITGPKAIIELMNLDSDLAWSSISGQIEIDDR